MDNTVRGQRILVVGGSSGIGLAVAKLVHGAGARVVIASRSAPQKGGKLAAEIGDGVELFALDVNSPSETAAVLKKIGAIDHLVVSIRAEGAPAPFVETAMKEAVYAFSTKFWGTYQLIQQSVGQLNKAGSIVMTSGIAGEKAYRNASTMAVINGAIEALCRSLALELAPIRVNVVSPGFVAPKPPEVEAYARQFPAARIADPAEVAASFLYLLCHPYTTGTILVADGGARLV